MVEIEEKVELSLDTLNDDCVFEILKRLPTNYLYTIAETCARLYDLSAIQYRYKHQNKFVCLTMNGDKVEMLPDEHDVKIFGRKFLNMFIYGYGRNYNLDTDLLQFIQLNCSPNWQILRFENAMLDELQLKLVKNMMHRVETLVIHKCGMLDDFYDGLLSECHRLKRLILSDSHPIISDDSKWLEMKYPFLESIEICSITIVGFQREQWTKFFQQNPQIKSFSCDHWYSTDVTDRPVSVIVKHAPNLTKLYLSMRGIGHLNGTYYDLSVLCQREKFQSLDLQFNGTAGIQYLTRHSKMLAKMKKLHTLHLTANYINTFSSNNNANNGTPMLFNKETATMLTPLQSIKRIHFVNVFFNTDFAETISTSLPNLEEIHCNRINDFTPFIRNASKLTKIYIPSIEIGALNLGWGLHWLNDERAKIPFASPITIFVKKTATENAEQTIITSGIITIKPLKQDKRILTNVKNSFTHF